MNTRFNEMTFLNSYADVDECLEKVDKCDVGACVNMVGNYRCICPQGYDLVEGGHRCAEGT